MEPTAIHPFAAGKTMLCRHLFKTTPLFHQNIGVGKAKQRRCFKTSTSGLLESAWHSLVVRLARTPLPLAPDSQ